MVYNKKLAYIRREDESRFNIWKRKSDKNIELKINPIFYYLEPLNDRFSKVKDIFEKYKNLKINQLLLRYKEIAIKPITIDELDIDILSIIFYNTTTRPFSELDGSMIEEILKYLPRPPAKRYITRRLKKLEESNLINRATYGLKSLGENHNGGRMINFIGGYRSPDIKYPNIRNESIGFPSPEFISFLTNSPFLNIEITFAIKTLKRIGKSKRFSPVYKEFIRKYIILCLIELNKLR